MLWGIPNILSLQQHSGKLIHFSVRGNKTKKKTWPCVDKSGKPFPQTCCSFHLRLIRHLNLTCVDVWLSEFQHLNTFLKIWEMWLDFLLFKVRDRFLSLYDREMKLQGIHKVKSQSRLFHLLTMNSGEEKLCCSVTWLGLNDTCM